MINTFLDNWHFFALSIAFFLTIGLIINRYSPKVYPISTSLLIKQEDFDGSAVEILYDGQFGNNKNLINEIIILKSYPLVYDALKHLDFDKVIFAEGNFKTSEIYLNRPFEIVIDSTSTYIPYNQDFSVNLEFENRILVYLQINGDPVKEIDLEYGQWGDIEGFRFKLDKTPNFHASRNSVRQYKFRLLSLEVLTRNYIEKLTIEPVERDASILNISINGEVPEKEVDFLHTLTQNYITRRLEEKNINATKSIEFIDSQLAQITDSLAVLEGALELFKAKSSKLSLSQDGMLLYEKIEGVESEKVQVEAKLRYCSYLQEYLEKAKGSSSGIVVPSTAGLDDPVLNQLVQKLVEKQVERESLSIEPGRGNAITDEIDQRISFLKENILENLTSIKQTLLRTKEDIDNRIQRIEVELQSLPGIEREYINLKRVYDLGENLYIFLMEKRAEAAISKASTSADAKLINPAMLTGPYIYPQKLRNILLGIIVGLGLPVGFFYVRQFLNNKVQAKEDLTETTDIPLLGIIGQNKNEGNLVVLGNPKSGIAESFRSVRSNLQFFNSSNKSKNVYLITSSISGEGKTFCSINLALVFSISGKRTLIFGADMRRPRVYQDLNCSNNVGLSNYLAGTKNLDSIIQPTDIDNLDLISAGPIPPNPSELLLNEHISGLIKRIKEMYDIIIIDTPPVGLVTDAVLLMKYTDHNIYVVRQDYTPIEAVINADELFKSKDIQNVSIIFNDTKMHKRKYGGYSYGYGYGYYEEPSSSSSFFKKLLRKS